MEQETKEWLEIESLVSGLADIARKIKEMQKCSESDDNCNTSDENCKTYYRGMLSDERCKKAESAIESDPEAAAAILPKGSDIQQEAIQAVDGGNDAEVNNKVVDNFVRHGWEDVTEIPEWNTEQKRYDKYKRAEWLNDYNRAGREVFEALNNPSYAIHDEEKPITKEDGETGYSGLSRARDLEKLLWREPDFNSEDLSKLGSAYRNISSNNSSYMKNMIANAYKDYLRRNKDTAEDYYSDENLKEKC